VLVGDADRRIRKKQVYANELLSLAVPEQRQRTCQLIIFFEKYAGALLAIASLLMPLLYLKC